MDKSTNPTRLFGRGIFSKAVSKVSVLTVIITAVFCSTASAQAGNSIKYAKGLAIINKGSFKLVNIINYSGDQKDTLQYLLLNRNSPRPAGYPNAQIIRTPIKKLVGMSSMHIAMAEFAGAADLLVGQGSLKYVSSAKVRNSIKAGKIKEVGLDGELNRELIIAMRPDAMLTMGNPDAKFSRYQTLIKAGVPVVIINEWLESHPLGRMEWVKLLGALVNREALVTSKFNRVVAEYNRLSALSKRARSKPLIITGMPFKGTWFVPDADSYNTQLFKDAGASYRWSKEKGTGSLPLSFETVAPVALQADYWLNLGYVDSKKDIVAKDQRYAAFKPVKTGKLYNFNKRVNDIGSNDFWESGGMNPHLVLSDLIKILHPELLPNHKLVYYKQLR